MNYDSEELKNITLAEVSKYTKLPVLEGYQDCPFCSRKNKFRVKGKYFKCFSPSCAKHGDVFSYLTQIGVTNSYTESLSFIEKHTGKQLSYVQGFKWGQTLQIMKEAFFIYHKAFGVEAFDYLSSRGYQTLDSYHIRQNVGYAGTGTPLQDAGISLGDLLTVGLAYDNGTEYYTDRVIFAIRDQRAQISHLQGRSLDPEEELRWKSTRTPENRSMAPVSSFLYNVPEAVHYSKSKKKTLCLCEGVTDTISLSQLSIPAVGSFGININLVRHASLFERFSTLVVLMDGDRFSVGNPYEGLYKSWSQIVRSLKDLQKVLPELNILCCPPPSHNSIKDVNDWYMQGLTVSKLEQHVKNTGKSLLQFCVDEFSHRLDYQNLLLDLVSYNPTNENKTLLQKSIESTYRMSTVDYLLEIKGAA